MRLKDFSILNPAYQGDTLEKKVSFVPMESLRNGKIDYQEIPFSEAKGKYTFFANGDLLIAKVTPCFENGNIAIANDMQESIGFGSSEIFVLRLDKNVLNTYMFYVVQTSNFQDSACATMCGVGGLKRISPLFMRTYELNVPTLSVQQKIVNYLDEKNSAIDTQIELLEKKKDAYTHLKKAIINRAITRGLDEHVKLKKSGVEWIGMIPVHWNVKRIKDISYMYSGLSGKSGDDFRCDDENLTKCYIPFTNILNNTVIDTSHFMRVVMRDGEKQNAVKENDIIFLMSSEDYESIAKSAVVIDDPGEVYLNSFCRGIRITSNSVYSPFVNYQLNSEVYRDALRFEARGFTRINIKIDRIAGHFVTLPTYEEQQAITAYLDKKCAKIDAAIANIDKQTDALKRLKRSLINEVITGQRAV